MTDLLKRIQDIMGVDPALETHKDGAERAGKNPGELIEYTIVRNGMKLPHSVKVTQTGDKYLLDIKPKGSWHNNFDSYRVDFEITGLLITYAIYASDHRGLKFLTQDIRTYEELTRSSDGLTMRAYAEGFTMRGIIAEVLPMVASFKGTTSVIDHLDRDNRAYFAKRSGGLSLREIEEQRMGATMRAMGYAHLEVKINSRDQLYAHWAKFSNNLFFTKSDDRRFN